MLFGSYSCKWMDGWMDEWNNGQMDGWMARTDRYLRDDKMMDNIYQQMMRQCMYIHI